MSHEGWELPEFPFPNINPNRSNDPNQPTTHQAHAAARAGGSGVNGNPGGVTEEQNILEGGDVDPRNVTRRKQTKPKKPEENFLHKLIREFLGDKGVISVSAKCKKGKDQGRGPNVPDMPPAVDPMLLEAYCNRDHRGPTKEFMPISWSSPMTHAWNEKVIQLLAAEFRGNVRACQYQGLTSLPTNENGEDPVFVIIRNKIISHQTKLRAAGRKRTQARSEHLSRAELEEIITQEENSSRTRSRRSERRNNLWIRRNNIITEVIDSPDADEALWREIQRVFDLFDEHDMSSDETEAEAEFSKAKTVRRIRKHWIDEEVSKIFLFIDQHYSRRTSSGTLKRGCPPLLRTWESKAVDKTSPPKANLPRNVYSKDLIPAAVDTLNPQPPIMLPMIPQASFE